MGWNISYNRSVAECAYDDIKKGGQLVGFDQAEALLKSLKRELENLASQAGFWAENCKQSAVHYESAQKDLRDNPQAFDASDRREIMRKSPSALYDCSAKLRDGANKAQSAISVVNEILTKLNRAKEDAKENSQQVLDKIRRAIDLMHRYLTLNF